MFYEPAKKNHGLAHDPFKACIVPRPIAWISTLSINGIVNVAPYSYFNAVSDSPAIVMFSTTTSNKESGPKDTLRNCEDTEEFVVNMVDYKLREAVNISSASIPNNYSELDLIGDKVQTLPARFVKPPLIKQSPINLECKTIKIIQLPVNDSNINRVVFGEVIGIHINDDIITHGMIDITKMNPISRLGYMDYTVTNHSFTMQRPE